MFTFEDLIARPPVSRAELAQRAGISRNTEWTLREDHSRARVDTLREIALACGYDLEIALLPAHQPEAAAAARDLLGDLTNQDGALPRGALGTPEVFGMNPDAMIAGLGPWRERLLRYVRAGSGAFHARDPISIAAEAAPLAAPTNAPAVILLTGRNDVDRLMSAALATSAEYRDHADVAERFGHRWVFSGGVALQALGAELAPDLTAGISTAERTRGGWSRLPTVVWSSLPTEFSRYLGDTHRKVGTVRAANVIIAPLAPHHLVRTADLDGVPLVSPVQALIDSLGVGGELGRTALDLATGW